MHILTSPKELLQEILDALFPPSSESLCVRKLTTEDVLRLLEPKRIESITALASFQTIALRALVHEAKFHYNRRAHFLLGTLLAAYLRTQDWEQNTILVPIPLSRAHYAERGYNQVTEILKNIQDLQPGVLIQEKILTRTRNTRPQTSLTRKARLNNLREAFAVPRRMENNISHKHIILIDDVVTTGATMHAAKAALLPHQPQSITCLALAH